MRKLQFSNLVMLLQEAFAEDLMVYVNSEGNGLDYATPETENPIAGYLLTKLSDSFDEDADNSEKISSFYSILDDLRLLADDVERSLDMWEDLVGDDHEYD